MRILLDHNTPAPLRDALAGHQVETAYERGWAELTNGELLSAAEAYGFDLLITTDKGIRYQQNLTARRLSLLVLRKNDWAWVWEFTGLVVSALTAIRTGEYIEVEIPTS